MIVGTSAEVLPLRSNQGYDLILVDGDHTAVGVAFNLAVYQLA